MKKKLLSLLLALAMCLSLCVPAWAAEQRSGISLSPELQQTYAADMVAFQRTFFLPSQLSVANIDNSGKITYQYTLSDLVTGYADISYTDESVILDVYEGDRHDTIEYLDGGIKINGAFYAYQLNSANTPATRARTTQYSANPPAGYSTGAYYFSHREETNRFDLPKAVASYTVAALCAALALRFFPTAINVQEGAILYALISNGVGILIQNAIDTFCTNTYLSYRISYYEHENSSNLDLVYRCYAYYYNDEDCEGSYTSMDIYYCHNYFS